MLYVPQFREHLVREPLRSALLYSESAENLLIGTAMVESGLTFVRQLGVPVHSGAYGIYQCEERTYYDVIDYLERRGDIRKRIVNACRILTFPPVFHLMGNIRLATLIARVHYWRIPEALPNYNDADGLCEYYLKYYNTYKGKSTYEKSIPFFKDAVSWAPSPPSI